ncbi:nucleotidyltransferase domain-containing protein [Patescibacteria group bacterium]|nr:nucleotidyltransferase domain-containing protein [Patescibacteria group bacterium]
MSRLIARARLAGKILRFVPFLRLAALNGSIVRGVENKQSDIDILIIARAGRLYTCRAFAAAFIHLTGWRRHGKKVAGRLCLNCYLNDKSPNIFPHRKNSAKKVAKAYKYLIPLVDDGILRKFYKINRWFDDYSFKGEEHSRLLSSACFKKFPLKPKNQWIEKLFSGRLGNLVEYKLMIYQTKRIYSSATCDDELVATSDEIRLHPKKFCRSSRDTKYIFIFMVVLFSFAIGFFTGLYPARRAERVDALDVLRYE